MNTRDSAKAFDALMQETPYSHFDSGCEGIISLSMSAASSSLMMSTTALTMTRSAFSTLRSRKCRKCPTLRSLCRI